MHQYCHDVWVSVKSADTLSCAAIGFGGALFVLAYNMVRSVMPCNYS